MLSPRLRLYEELEAIAADYEGLFDSPVAVEDYVADGRLTRIALARLEPFRTESTTRYVQLVAEVNIPAEGRVDVGADGECYALTPIEVAYDAASELMLAQLAKMDLAPRRSRVSIEPPEKRIKARVARPA